MIRINLLGGERKKTTKAVAFDIGQRVTLLSSLVIVVAVAGIGWWYQSLASASAQVDAEMAAAEQEAVVLRAMVAEMQGFEAQRARIQQRVTLIEGLRSGQSVPVRLLDHVSRSLPDLLWLTAMTQDANQVTIEGQSTQLLALSDFVRNLSDSALLQKPIEIVDSKVQTASGSGAGAAPELVQFTVRAQLTRPESAEAEPTGRGAGAAARAPRGAARSGGPRSAR